MKKFYSIAVDVIGKIMLAWFFFATFVYFYSGRFYTEITSIWSHFNLWSIYSIIQVPVASLGIFIMIPLLLKGSLWGIILGVVHWGLGYFLNPLWYIFPSDIQLNPTGGSSGMLVGINIFYSAFTLLILVLFYLQRRAQSKLKLGT
ncbi:MAG: hypothetical protein GY797_32595 [Deltaproteobacteria bacterium]|nr:hypothetical protein [Deltaproteobacteria bacterium]